MKSSQDVSHLLESDDINQSESCVDLNNVSSTDVSIIPTTQAQQPVSGKRKGWRYPNNMINANIPFSPSLGFRTGINLTSGDLNQRMVDRLAKMTISSSSSEGEAGSHLEKVISRSSRVTEDAINTLRKKRDFRSLSIFTRPLSDNRAIEDNRQESVEMTSHLKREEGCLRNHHSRRESSLESFCTQNSLLTSPGIPSSTKIPSKISSQVLFSAHSTAGWTSSCDCHSCNER